MEFGVFSVCMPEYSPEETLAILSEIGYEGIEWRIAETPDKKPVSVPFEARYWVNNKSTLDISKIEAAMPAVKALSIKYGIKIFGLSTYLHPGKVEEINTVLKASDSIDCRQVRVFVHNDNMKNSKKNYRELFDEATVQVRALETLAKMHNVKIVFEIHMDSIIASPSAAYRLVSRFDPQYIGLILDPGNMVFEGYEEYQKSFELLGDYVSHVHIKNGLLEPDGIDEYGAKKFIRKWVPLNEGMADLRNFFSAMKKCGYNGTVCIEDFSNNESTYEKLKNGLVYLKQLSIQ